MRFLYDNAAVIGVALLCSAFTWLYGGTVAAELMPTIPWLVALICELMICFPQRHSGETTFEARRRVWRAMKSDPLTWIVALFLILLTIPFVNKGLCPSCDYPEIHFDGANPSPPFKFLPYCVNRLEHLNVTIWFVSALLAMLAVKHSLLKRGKRKVLELIVWNGLALSMIGLLQYTTGANAPLWGDEAEWGEKVYFFSTFGYPNMAGDYFVTLFAISAALWRWKYSEVTYSEEISNVKSKGHDLFWRKHYFLIPAVIFFLSALMTLSRAAIILVSLLAVIFFIHSFISILSSVNRIKRVKLTAVNLLVLAIIGLIFYIVTSNSGKIIEAGDFNKEISTLNSNAILDRLSGKEQYHFRVATQVWKDNFLFGCGGWGYKHLSIDKMTDEDFKNLQQVGGINVHNDFLQFLAEHGLIGVLMLVSMVVLLFVPLVQGWKRLVVSAAFSKKSKRPPRPIAIFALPASAFFLMMAMVATLLHSMADCPLRSPAVLTLFFVMIAAIDGFMPKFSETEN